MQDAARVQQKAGLAAVRREMDWIDYALRRAPNERGESRLPGCRLRYEDVLGDYYRIDDEALRVEILFAGPRAASNLTPLRSILPVNMPTIRAAVAADWPAIWELFRAAAAGGDVFAYDEATTEETARKLWFEPPAVAFVAEEEGRIAGTYYVRPNQPGRGSHIANGGYIVAPDARGRGLARRMCEHSLKTARHLGFTAMQFNYVVASNAAAIRTWERCGFAVVGRLPGAFRHKELGRVDVLVMYREL